MNQVTIDMIQSFAILGVAIGCICNSLCIPRLKDYDERFSLMYWVHWIKDHFHRNSSTGAGGFLQSGKQANEKDLSCSPKDVSKTSDSQPTAHEESTMPNTRLRNR